MHGMGRLLFLLIFSCFFALQARAEKIALVQYLPLFDQTQKNQENLTEWADKAIEMGAKVIVFPEGAIHGYLEDLPNHTRRVWAKPDLDKAATFDVFGKDFRFKGPGEDYSWNEFMQEDVSRVAESIPNGPSTQYWAEYAKKNQVYILVNLPEKDGEFYYNTSVALGPYGFTWKYRKRLLYYVDLFYATPGDVPFVWETPWARLGCMTCVDAQDYNNFMYDLYKQMGADAILINAFWGTSNSENSIGARKSFIPMSQKRDSILLVSDTPLSDGTGLYRPEMSGRIRNGLVDKGLGVEGISIHNLCELALTPPHKK